MNKRSFDRLVTEVRRTWTPKSGAVALLGNKSNERVFRLTAGREKNDGLIAENCKLWDSLDELCYRGPLEKDLLKRLLHEASICRCRVTTFRSVNGKGGTKLCLGNPDKCGVEACAWRKYAEQVSV